MSSIEEITLPEALKKLEMDDAPSSGLKWVAQRAEETQADIYIALEQAAVFGATAVYFRFFSDDRSPRPQVYIYAPESSDFAVTDAADIQHRLWNAGTVPYCFIFTASKLWVYNCGKKPSIDDAGEHFITKPDDIIDLLSDVQENLQAYSARQFDSGLFWDSATGKDFKYDQSAYEQLLTQLKNVKANIISSVGAGKAELVKRLLMMLILIKYLEERKDENGNGALDPASFYKDFNAADPTLSGVLADTDQLVAMLSILSSKEHFNGRFFSLTQEEIAALKEIGDMEVFRMFVEGKVYFTPSSRHGIGQMSLWRLYQFNYLPIELISHIYEDFLADETGQKKKGVVYTPPYLVQFLIDRCMPLSKPQANFKILDPACGSGIFLVGAFKRMIQWWRLTHNWAKPAKEDIEDLKAILRNNIYGCDLEEEAVTLSYFSLGLALLDALSPKEIWNNVHFDDLIGQNLLPGDFFETLDSQALPADFQLVIGNPPFNSKLTGWADKINKAEIKKTVGRPALPDNQIALLFLEQSFSILAPGGHSCLILPSGPLLYNTQAHSFKKHLFSQHFFREIYDFTPLRAKLFIGSSSSAKPAVLVSMAEKRIPTGASMHHIIFRRTRASAEKIEFETDHYDIHQVPYPLAMGISSIWQANFMGGGRLHRLLQKIAAEENLGTYLKRMKNQRHWQMGEGWIESSPARPLQRLRKLKAMTDRSIQEDQELNVLENKYRAEWITGHPFVETDSFTEDGIEGKSTCDIQYFYRSAKKNQGIFQPPHLLIKEQAGQRSIPVELRDDYLTFRNEIFGIACPPEDRPLLATLAERLKGNTNYSALLWLLSGRIITTREGVVLKNDILSLPFPQDKLEFDPIEKILLEDVALYYAEFRKEGETSELLLPPTSEDLELFGQMYCRILNSVYQEFRPLTPICSDEFIAYPFCLGEAPNSAYPPTIGQLEAKLNTLIDNREGHNLWIKRILKIYDQNVVFFYKPNQKRYWLRSIAVRDADETFADLYHQGK